MEGGSAPVHRALCLRCLRPRRACWCPHLRPVESVTRACILQHVRERKTAIGTARMAHLSLPNSELHLGVSFLLTLAGQYVLESKAGLDHADALPLSAGFSLTVGLGKEVADSQRTRAPAFSWRDLAADALGVALAALVIVL